MAKYKKVINPLNNKTGYISLNYFLNHGIGILEFASNKWIYGYDIPKGAEIIED